MLDQSSGELNPLGYNHELFKNMISGASSDAGVINVYAADNVASGSYAALVKKTFGQVAP